MTDTTADTTTAPPLTLAAAPTLPRPTRLVLQAEAAAASVAILVAYGALGGSWLLFIALWLVPDVALLAYLAGPLAGGLAYNAVHSTVGPLALGLLAWATGGSALGFVALIWLAHVAMDRAMGFGLKTGRVTATHLSGAPAS